MHIVITGNTPSQKNRKKISTAGRYPRLYTEKSVRDWQDSAAEQLKAYRGQADGKVVITYMFYVKDNRRRDLSNMIQSVEDALVKAGLIKDDSWQHIALGSADAEIDKDNPRAELWIEEI